MPDGTPRGRHANRIRFRLRGRNRMWYTAVRCGRRRENRLPRWLRNCWKLRRSEVEKEPSGTVSGVPSCSLSTRLS